MNSPHSSVENNIYPLHVLEERFRPGGSVIRANWDYERSAIDLTIEEKGSHYFVHIPFYAVQGSLDFPGITVRLEKPYFLGRDTSELDSVTPTFSVASHDWSGADKRAGEVILQKVAELLLPG
ncbi:YugN family protein [Lentibacillus juripiscarius]|uniref:YugN family protein n=1 Tax=Lentibacillus juripiscarius TaxID=257446 RepID=A0ABW5V5G5_9BACI